MNRILVLGIVLILISSGCQPSVNANCNANGIENGAQALRFITHAEGYYRITSQELRSHGFIAASTDQIQLNFEGESYPYWWTESTGGSEFALQFYAPPAGRFLSDQVFILEKKSMESSGDVSHELRVNAVEPSTIHQMVQFREEIEPQEIYLSQAGKDDPWLWQNIDPREGIQIPVLLNGDDLTGQIIELEFWSPANAPASPDHAIHAWLNDSDLGIFDWEGAGWKTIRIPLEALPLVNENSLKLEIFALENVAVQKIYLDRVLVEGKSNFIPGTHPVTFYSEETTVGFETTSSSGSIVELDTTRKTMRTAEIVPESGFALETVNNARYDWLPDDGFLKVDQVEVVNWPNDLTISETPVDWLVIAPKQYHDILQPLITLRSSQGLSTMLVDAQQIYDQFYSGNPDPQALTGFFKTINSKWQEFPENVLIVGDFTYAHQTYEQAITNVPSCFVDSAYAGETVSDLPLMDLDDDNLPDFVIGRLPASNSQQLKNWVQKLVNYESNETRSGINQIVAIADNQDASFGNTAKTFLSNFSNNKETFLFDPEKEQDSIQDTIRSFFNGSTDLMVYFGHGSIDIWGKEHLFSTKNVAQLNQKEMIPLIVNFSCLTGYYIHPQNLSMMEALLFQDGGGSIAVIAPTSLTFQTYQSILSTVFANELQSDKNYKLGDVIKPAWRSMDPENTSSLEVMQTFLLFGDPAMTIHP